MQNMSRNSLLKVIDDIRARVASGDSMEGHLHYAIGGNEEYMEWDIAGRQGPPPKPPHPYDVEATYRIGNLLGQGGYRMVGLPKNVPP